MQTITKKRKAVVQKKKKEMATDQRKNSSAVAISSKVYDNYTSFYQLHTVKSYSSPRLLL